MQHSVLAALVLIIAGAAIAGSPRARHPRSPQRGPGWHPRCGSGRLVVPAFLLLGDHYLQKSYSFQSESDHYTEKFQVDNSSWGIDFNILPLNDDPQYCWFRMNVTNVNTPHR